MNKIFEFINKNDTILIVTIFLFYYLCIKKPIENMKCDFDRPRYNYFFRNNKHIIDKYNFSDKINLVKSIFNFNPNKNSYKKDNKTLEDFTKVNEIYNHKEKFVQLITELLNSNRIWNRKKDYIITEKTKISEIRHIWLLDKLLTDLKCGFDSKELILQIKKLLNGGALKMCDENELIKYCKMVSGKPKIGKLNNTHLEEEYKYLLKGEMAESDGNVLNSFELVSIKNNVINFGPGYYNNKNLDKILVSLIDKFENKYSRKYNKLDRNDLVKLVLLYVPILQKKINLNISTDKKEKTQKDLDRNKKLFYLLKHQYTLISIYNLINHHIKDKKKREYAYKCCSSKNNKGKCFDFDKGTKSNVLIYGFNKYGYVKDTKCTPEYNRDLFDKQRKTFNLVLSDNSLWNDSSNKTKEQFYKNLKNLFNYFKNKKININIGKSSISNLLVILEGNDINNILPDKINTITGYTYTMGNKMKKIINSIQLAKSISTVLKLANDSSLNNFNFLSLGKNIDKIKFASIKLLEIRDLLVGNRANISMVNKTMLKMLALEKTSDDYYNILIKGGILLRNHDDVMNGFSKILSDIKKINIIKMSLSGKPHKVIKYIKEVFPYVKDMDVCKIYTPILKQLRNKRQIETKEYLDFKNVIGDLCSSRKTFINKNKPMLFKDSNGRIREVRQKTIINNKGKEVKILIRVNSKNQTEVVNIKDNIIQKTNLIVKNNKILDKNDSTKSGSNIKVTTIDPESVKNTTITIDKQIVKEKPKIVKEKSDFQNNLNSLANNFL